MGGRGERRKGDGREGREEEGWWERGRGMRTTVA